MVAYNAVKTPYADYLDEMEVWNVQYGKSNKKEGIKFLLTIG